MTIIRDSEINPLWPHFDTHQIARLLGVYESDVYNHLAWRRGHTERRMIRPMAPSTTDRNGSLKTYWRADVAGSV